MQGRYPSGKGIFIWKIVAIEQGDPVRIAEQAKALGLQWVCVKVADGTGNYNLRLPLLKDDLIGPLVEALRDRRIGVWGWHYVYGANPEKEAAKSLERIRKFRLDGLLVDAETEYKGRYSEARRYALALRAGTDVPLGLSSYRFPSYHMTFPWKQFLEQMDFHAPQVYWEGSHNPAEQLDRSVAELRRMADLPVVPAGSAYQRGTWKPAPAELDAFDRRVRELKLPGVHWWDWGNAEKAGFLGTLAAHPWAAEARPVSPPEVLTLESLDGRVRKLERAFDALGRG